MGASEIILIVLIFGQALYLEYKLWAIKEHLQVFYHKQILSFDDYERLRSRYSGFLRYHASAPEKLIYPLLYKDDQFVNFISTHRTITWCLRILTLLAAFNFIFSEAQN